MNVSPREFRIAASAALFGFFLCYFLVGEETPPRTNWKMTIITSVSNAPTPPNEIHLQLNRTNAQSPDMLKMLASKPRPELTGETRRHNVDLFSSKYRGNLDWRDLR